MNTVIFLLYTCLSILTDTPNVVFNFTASVTAENIGMLFTLAGGRTTEVTQTQLVKSLYAPHWTLHVLYALTS